MGSFVTKQNVAIEGSKFQLYKLIPGVAKFCTNYVVRSPIGIQYMRNNDYVIKLPSGNYFGVPRELFELLMEEKNGNI